MPEVPTVNLPSATEEAHPQNSMVEQPKNQISDLQFEKSLRLRLSSDGKRVSRQKCFQVQITLQNQCVGFKKSRWLLLWTLKKTLQNSHFRKRVHSEVYRAQKDDRFLRGRQIAIMIYEQFQVTGTHVAILDYSDLFSVLLHVEDVQGFDTRWDEVLLSHHLIN